MYHKHETSQEAIETAKENAVLAVKITTYSGETKVSEEYYSFEGESLEDFPLVVSSNQSEELIDEDYTPTQWEKEHAQAEESEEENREDWKLLVDENRGIYAPQNFVERYIHSLLSDNDLTPNLLRSIADVLEGPDNENYWESMEDIERDCTIVFAKDSRKYRIVQDGDIWAVPLED